MNSNEAPRYFALNENKIELRQILKLRDHSRSRASRMYEWHLTCRAAICLSSPLLSTFSHLLFTRSAVFDPNRASQSQLSTSIELNEYRWTGYNFTFAAIFDHVICKFA